MHASRLQGYPPIGSTDARWYNGAAKGHAMETDGELRTEPLTRAGWSSAIGGLTTELQHVVEQLEEDWQLRHRIRLNTAEDLHDLRLRAERLLSSSA